MAIKIRLTRTGAKNSACYRIVVADVRSPRDGRAIEVLGWYDPKKADDKFGIKQDRIDYWISQGAQLSQTVDSLLKQAAKTEA